MATQTFEKRLEKALLDAAKNGANVTYYNFAGAQITGNIYINNGVPHVSKPTVEAPQKDTTAQPKAKKTTKTEQAPVVAAPTVEDPKEFKTESFEAEDDDGQEKVKIETQDDSSQDDSQGSEEIQVAFDNDSKDEDIHVYKRLTQIRNTLAGGKKIKLMKRLNKCRDSLKDVKDAVGILAVISKLDLEDVSDFDDTIVCNFKNLQTFEDAVRLFSVDL